MHDVICLGFRLQWVTGAKQKADPNKWSQNVPTVPETRVVPNGNENYSISLKLNIAAVFWQKKHKYKWNLTKFGKQTHLTDYFFSSWCNENDMRLAKSLLFVLWLWKTIFVLHVWVWVGRFGESNISAEWNKKFMCVIKEVSAVD